MSGVRAYGKIDADQQAQIQARKQSRRRLFIIIGCSLFLVAAIVAVTVGVVISKKQQNSAENDGSSPSGSNDLSSGSAAIQTACNATLYPDVCLDTLSNNTAALSANPLQLVIISVQLAMEGVREAYNLSVSLRSSTSPGTLEYSAADDCVELLDLAMDELSESINGLESLNLKSLSKALQNVEIVISTASSLQTGCLDGLSNITGSGSIQLTQEQVYVNKLIINALSLVQALASLGSSLSSWKKSLPSIPSGLHFRRLLSSNDDELPDWAAALDRRLLDSTSNSSTNASSLANLVVGPGENYTSLVDALNAVPDSDSYPNGDRFVIYIKEGTYYEGPLNITKTLVNLTLLGDGCGKTIITGNASVSGSNNVMNGLSVTTYRSATVGIVAKGFIAKDITFQNTAGPIGHQAVALRASADGFVFQSCCFEGYQDTLYAHSGRQFYRDCKISGTVDFLFGDSLAIFQNCELQARIPSTGQQNTYTAQGKKEPNTVTGFSFQNTSLTAASGLNSSVAKSYLGRPWKTYSTTVFLKSNIGGHVDGAGWLSWNQSRPFEDTCTYGEYENSGAGSDISQRVNWSCVNSQMSASQAADFSVASLLPDTSFVPTDVPIDTSI